MKIEGLTGAHTTLQACSGPRSTREQARGFAEILARAVGEGPERPEASECVAPAGEVQGPARAVVANCVANLLSALEAYVQALGDNALTLKQIQPFVQRLEKEADTLERALATHRADETLGEIAREGLVHARSEIIKFWRGEYV